MSKNIILRRNDTGETRTLSNVSRLQTNAPGGLPVNWLEEDETSKVADVNITKNGKYTAYALGVYGIKFAHVAVDFSQPVTLGGITYQIHIDNTGKPHISVSRALP